MLSVLTLWAMVVGLNQDTSLQPGTDAPPEKNVPRNQVLIVLGPLDLGPRARAIADTKRLLRDVRGRPGVRVVIVDGPRLVQPATLDAREAEAAVDRSMASLRNPGPADAMDASWVQATTTELRKLALRSGSKSMLYFAQADRQGSAAQLVPQAVRAGVAIYPIFVGELATAGPAGEASANTSVASLTGELLFEPEARAGFSFSQASRELGRLGQLATATGGELVTKDVRATLRRIAGGPDH